MGAVGAVTGVFVNNHYRTRLRLGKFGYISSYVPIVVLPAIMASLFHRTFIQSRILLAKDTCPLCVQLRAAAMQVTLGTVYPTLLAPFASYMVRGEYFYFFLNRNANLFILRFQFAVRHFTYRLPSITEDPKGLFRVYQKMTRPLTMGLTISLGLNALIACALTYREQLDFMKLQYKIQKEERWAEEQYDRSQMRKSL